MSDASLEPRLEFVTCASPAGLHRMAYWEWGDPANDQVVVCVHGLTRSGRDFDTLARRLAGRYRVVCPDVVGRGRSDWLVNPAFYTVPQYVSDMVTLVARLRPARLSWVGTSMGGLIGLGLAGAAAFARAMLPLRPHVGMLPPQAGVRLEKLVLNDVGPRLETGALARIGQYVGEPGAFGSFAEAVANMRANSGTFGPHTDEQWEHLARFVYPEQDGKWVKHYDLALAQPMAMTPEELAAGEQVLWRSYDAIDCPILIVRGEQSDLLTRATTEEMRQRNPRAQLLEVPGVGHAPTLMADSQVTPVADFLLA
ncbi:2-succinyl-6-hydroxy-2, 4-cyclohexadiene-1-carboxylate synthase [Achromobacter deleyi]|uniref:2-succinyl-6-hydroxy-2, 4-cyclohexadiene-1-carboxylate synthase n=1 Tax=Achromobacter deleyi TaxID=1353891 RepID=A0A6S7AUY8_9BURK|nr:alpha/beta hydrolase [Achromobacter deleyi]CAB3704516.1 2-succinyl-6-hydroxy-2, 4-cyclohexadiene-1-carboxylate synthase [Achromobacter deleyi]CAB3849155.1 2-succinyl-6-hydroxy-2, 4-cyclohexadiene-1-carboxylate synthase [Achromobacter deleyi]CAB3856218.1 2-succinyl-6-hydroxy-2, 4-cyclohexadiene-1-carboxylate synthase [Achromobacter deleyi]